jgi:hypothetical protein
MPNDDKNEEEKTQQYHMRQRQALNNAYAALEGQKTSQSFAAFTFEEAVDQQIELIEGSGTQLRPNELERVEKLKTELISAVTQLKQVPPEQFLEPDADEDVNTA